MDIEVIKNMIGDSSIGSEIVFLEEIDSTNVYAKGIADKASHGTLVIAEKQNSGRGRLGKTWDSPAGVGIWMSIILKNDINSQDIVKIPAMISLAVRKGIEESIGIKTQIKWPNDIIVNKKKVCGILIESLLKNNSADYIIVGIGVNVNQDENFFEDIPWASSISIQKGIKLDREKIIGRILISLEEYYKQFISTKALDLEQLVYNSVLMNKEVRVKFENEEIIGTVTGFKEDGSILIKSGGRVININSLKVSIRGLNEYID